MVRRISIVSALAIVIAISAQQAFASTVSSTSSGIDALNVRLGALFPGSGAAKAFGGETQLSAGLDYRLSTAPGVNPSASDVYLDFVSGAKNSGYVHSGGIGFDVRGMTGTTFYGAGLGLYNTSVRTNDGTSGSQSGAGGKLFAGVDLGSGTSLQLDYHILPSALGVRPSGLGVEVGFRL